MPVSRGSRGRGRRFALLCIAGGIAAAGFSAYLGRDYLRETWHLFRLDDLDEQGKKAAIEALGQIGADRSAEKLLEMAATPGIEKEATRALERVFPRLRPGNRAPVVKGLLRHLELNDKQHLKAALHVMGQGFPEVLPVFFEALDTKSPTVQVLACDILLESWQGSGSALETLLLRSGPERLYKLLLPAQVKVASEALLVSPWRSHSKPLVQKTYEVAQWIGYRHVDPKARAVALTFQVIRTWSGDAPSHDALPLALAYSRDESSVVRTAAIRVEGWLGNRQGGLDLTRILLTEDDPVLLTEAIQARTLRSQRSIGWREGLELWDGFVCHWLPANGAWLPKPWLKEEIDRLTSILQTRREPALRDACSLALASRYRDIDFFRTPGLRVITLIPRWMYDGLLPLEVFPIPEETVRVGLVWKECGDL